MQDAYREWVYNEIFRVIRECGEEAERGFHADMGDAFKAGRALA